MTGELFVKRAGSGPPVVLLHGLFGAGGNLGVLARDLQQDFTVYSLDLPSHGRSRWLAHPDLPSMAGSVQHWLAEQGLAHAHFVGHSLGGKVAMQLALQQPASVASLVVGDIAPVSYTAHHDTVFAGLEAVSAQRCASREEAATLLFTYLHEESVVQFLLSSLQRDADGIYRWRFDLAGLKAGYPALLAAPQTQHVYGGPVLFIRGGASDYLQDSHCAAIQACFPGALIETMAECGHWLHAQQPQQFNAIVRRFLEAVEHRKLPAIEH